MDAIRPFGVSNHFGGFNLTVASEANLSFAIIGLQISTVRFLTATPGVVRHWEFMPKYYLHIRDGDALIEDPEGIDLPDLNAAKEEAVQSARDLVAEQVKAGQVIGGQSFEIWSENEPVATVLFMRAINHP